MYDDLVGNKKLLFDSAVDIHFPMTPFYPPFVGAVHLSVIFFEHFVSDATLVHIIFKCP